MSHTEKENQNKFETDFHYAIVAGWLIIPAIGILFGLLSQIYHIFQVYLLGHGLSNNTYTIPGADFLIDLIIALYYAFIIIVWVKRRKMLPPLMIITLAITTVPSLIFLFEGVKSEWLYVSYGIIWIAYFIRSRRVRETFVK